MKALSPGVGGLPDLNPLKVTNGSHSLPVTSRYAYNSGKDMDARPSTAQTFPTRINKNPYFTRNNPHPSRVRHMKGLLDSPVCVVESILEDDLVTPRSHSFPEGNLLAKVGKQTIKFPLNVNAYRPREKAVPTIGLVPVTEDWRDQLRRIALASGLPLGNFAIGGYNSNRDVVSRQQSRGSQRNPLKEAEDEFVRNVTTRDGKRPPQTPSAPRTSPKAGERPKTQCSLMGQTNAAFQEKQDALRNLDSFDRAIQHISAFPDSETYVFQVLGKILQTDSADAIRNWLVSAPEREKELVVQMIQAVSAADEMALEKAASKDASPRSVHEPIYEDQLLQYESSVNVDEIKSFNEEENKKKHQTPRNTLGEPSNGNNTDRWIRPGTGDSNAHKSKMYEWSVNSLINKPSTPFKTKGGLETEANDVEIEEIRSKLASSHSVRVFTHQDSRKKTPSSVDRPNTNKSPRIARSNKATNKTSVIKTVAPFSSVQ